MVDPRYLSKQFSIICIFLLSVSLTVISNDDCMYNKCRYKFDGYGSHTPCMVTYGRVLVRNVECDDGNTIHICCRSPVREEIQKSRQNWFRFVTMSGTKISSNCIKRILCLQACLDGLNPLPRSDYPQVLTDDTPENREFVDAYLKGEGLSCFNHNLSDPKNYEHIQPDTEYYDESDCESKCQRVYSNCDRDMEESLLTEYFYRSSTIFHNLGMWSFGATWATRDFLERAAQRESPYLQVVKKAFETLYQRMLNMKDAYRKWLKRQHSNRNRRHTTDVGNPMEWNEFVIVYIDKDPDLVDVVFESLNYTQFENAITNINYKMSNYDFGSDVWTESGSRHIHACFYLFAVITLVSAYLYQINNI